MKDWHELNQASRAVILDLRKNGPDCAKFLSRRLKTDLATCMDLLASLETGGWLQRVKGTFLFKRGFRRPKHMNHTYYEITKKGERHLRFLARRGLI